MSKKKAWIIGYVVIIVLGIIIISVAGNTMKSKEPESDNTQIEETAEADLRIDDYTQEEITDASQKAALDYNFTESDGVLETGEGVNRITKETGTAERLEREEKARAERKRLEEEEKKRKEEARKKAEEERYAEEKEFEKQVEEEVGIDDPNYIIRKNIILDMDYADDVDDVCALRIASTLHRKQDINLLAVMLCVSNENAPKAAHAQLTYEGLKNIPIGRSSVDLEDPNAYWGGFVSKYFDEASYISMNATDLYIKMLEEGAVNGKTRIITTGYLTNIAELLKSTWGYAAVCNYVECIYITGGVYPSGDDYNFTNHPEAAEAIRYVQENSPVPLIFSTQATVSIGDDIIKCGDEIIKSDPDMKDPITLAFNGFATEKGVSLSEGRIAWDPMCVWAACMPEGETNIALTPAKITFNAAGGNTIDSSGGFNCQILTPLLHNVTWYKNELNRLLTL